jgi:hypothetical protein
MMRSVWTIGQYAVPLGGIVDRLTVEDVPLPPTTAAPSIGT